MESGSSRSSYKGYDVTLFTHVTGRGVYYQYSISHDENNINLHFTDRIYDKRQCVDEIIAVIERDIRKRNPPKPKPFTPGFEH
jgi:hypothetical protein